MKDQGFPDKEKSSQQEWLTEKHGSILNLSFLVGNYAVSQVQPSEVWIITVTSGNPKWNGSYRANKFYSVGTKNQMHVLGLF